MSFNLASMAPQQPQPDHSVESIEYQNFLKFLETELPSTNQESPIPCPAFIPHSSLKKYFHRDRDSLKRLLEAVIQEQGILDFEYIQTIREDYLCVLAILISLGCGRFLPRFVELDCDDHSLAFEGKPPHFPILPHVDFFDIFAARKWQFYPQTFKKGFYNKQLGDDRILPIVHKEELKQSTPATIYKVVLHEDYDQLLENSDENDRPSQVQPHTYVFKVFTGAHGTKAYLKERLAFTYLKNSKELGKSIIGCYGNFTHKGSHVIILEYADRGTLDDFLKKTDAPGSGEEAMKLWESLLTLQQALYTIHNIPVDRLNLPAEDKDFSILRGWHSDLKPANILVVSGKTSSPFDCQFRLADLGTSNFVALAKLGIEVPDVDAGVTKQFGPPESYQPDLPGPDPVVLPQKADIWSLGCIYSEFAVWIVHGRAHLRQYQVERNLETDKHGIQDVGCFHNGTRPLKCVKKWIDKAFANKRSNDHVTRSVLRKMVDEMLYEDADARPTANQLRIKARDILEKAKAHPTRMSRANKRQRLHDASEDESSSGESHFSPPVTPSQRVTLRGGLGRQSSNLLDTDMSEAFPLRTPSQTDPDNGTRETTPATPLSLKIPRTHNRQQSGPKQSNEVMCFSPDMMQSPEDTLSPPQSRYREERKPILQDNDQAVDEPNVLADELSGGTGHFFIHQPSEPYAEPAPQATRSPDAARPKVPKPSLTLDQALRYLREKKAGMMCELKDQSCLSTLAQTERDFVFIIDDAKSMQPHAKVVCDIVQFLAWLLKRYDKNGIDMWFLKDTRVTNAKSSSEIMQSLKSAMRKCQGTSDITHRLDHILAEYREKWLRSRQPRRLSSVFRSSSKVKPLVIYVLTDGEWDAGSDPSDMLRETAQFLKENGAERYQVGVQFISFGNNQENIAKLEHLDKDLKAARDIVDTEPITGNVYKMLLGPISRYWDDDDEQRI